MKIITQHITDPLLDLGVQVFTGHVVIEQTGSSIGRFIFTKHEPIWITGCLHLGQDARIEVGQFQINVA